MTVSAVAEMDSNSTGSRQQKKGKIHPNKKLSEKVHKDNPDQFPDPNHKPEIAVPPSRFEAFIGFKPLVDIQELIKLELLKPFLPATTEGLTLSDDETLRTFPIPLYASDVTVHEASHENPPDYNEEKSGIENELDFTNQAIHISVKF
ncbi:hypothetical protein Z517_09247 [Fonsecaea pedrosoi CBS 271.37]|uniref:Phosphomannose isomerase type I catalytic domain-containing protein n=1 Tax=Fonsecaea pedrosoi CBS 271.37 TaxID=1442368 RepID=A0A0D2G7Y9_9EURO|nr:uncharacterized protein Z517_09247 [Fonsecaea pedrosoi CBS 271.37]KIW76803.1 hypothetical protein Z517_09247 [Fonsecaea pedrosoi CBS 271.37]